MALAVCPSCNRHVKEEDACCPFCHCRSKSSVLGVAAVSLGLALTQGCYGAPPVRPDSSPPAHKPETEAPPSSATPR